MKEKERNGKEEKKTTRKQVVKAAKIVQTESKLYDGNTLCP